MAGRSGLLRRLGWGAADQAVSSLTNFALAVLVARSVGARSFGAFALVMSVYALVLGGTRAVVGEPLGIRHSNSSLARSRDLIADAAGAALVLGAACAAVLLAVSAVVPGGLRLPFLMLAVALPGLVLQDAWRYAFVAAGDTRRAFVNDVVWAVAQLGTILWLVGTGNPSESVLLGVWGASATVAALVGCRQAGVVPRPAGAGRWLRRHRDLWPRLGVEFGAMTGAWQLVMFLAGAVAGLVALGSIRAAQTLFGPLNLAFLTVPLVAVPELSRQRARGGSVLGASAVVGAGLCLLALAGGAVLAVMPAALGRELLGSSFASGHALLLPMTLLLASTGVNIGAIVGLRCMGAVDRSLRTRLMTAPLLVVSGATGAVLGGAFGAASALALANWIAAALWWRQLVQVTAASGEGSE